VALKILILLTMAIGTLVLFCLFSYRFAIVRTDDYHSVFIPVINTKLPQDCAECANDFDITKTTVCICLGTTTLLISKAFEILNVWSSFTTSKVHQTTSHRHYVTISSHFLSIYTVGNRLHPIVYSRTVCYFENFLHRYLNEFATNF